MGKSNKKIKSDRINALRKQYDAFVEEDKKRKERNEYILGKLDKMRYSTALVPVRNKHLSPINRPSLAYQHLGYPPEVSVSRDLQPPVVAQSQIISDMPIKTIDDTYLIQEISKNYILIPKLRSPFTSNYIPQAPPVDNMSSLQNLRGAQTTVENSNMKDHANDTTDWKSKYEILNILKKEETEEQAKPFPENKHQHHSSETLSKNDIPLNNVYQSALNDNKVITGVGSTARYKYLDEVPEKESPVETVNYGVKINDETNDYINTHPAESISDTITQNNVMAAGVEGVDDINYTLQNTNLEYSYPEDHVTNASGENAHYAEHNQYYTEPTDQEEYSGKHINSEGHIEPNISENVPLADQNVELTDNTLVANENVSTLGYQPNIQAQSKHEDPEKMVYVHEQDVEPAQVISSNDLMGEIAHNDTAPISDATEYVKNEPEINSAQELSSNADVQMKNLADHTFENLEVGQGNVEVEHQGEYLEPPTQTITDASEIQEAKELPDAADLEDYEAEQQKLFYLNTQDQNFEHQQGDVNVYDQTPQPNEVYPQNEDYSYYENTQQQPYPAEMGENDEQNLQYDQNYSQQYVDPYQAEYEKPQQYEESPGDLQPYEQGQVEQLHNMTAYEGESYQKRMESELDTEDGYVQQTEDVNIQQVDQAGSEVNK